MKHDGLGGRSKLEVYSLSSGLVVGAKGGEEEEEEDEEEEGRERVVSQR